MSTSPCIWQQQNRRKTKMIIIQKSIGTKAPPKKIWPLLTEPNQIMRWFTAVQEFKYTSRRRSGAGITFYYMEKVGPRLMKFNFKVTEWEKEEKLGFTMTEGPMKKNDQAWIVKANPKGSVFTILMEMEMPWGIIGRILEILFVNRMAEKHVKEALTNLRRLAEV